MLSDAPIKWLVIGLVVLIDAAWMLHADYRFVMPWSLLGFAVLMIIEAQICHRCWWATDTKWVYDRVGHCCHMMAQLTVFLCAAVILSDLVATANAPFIDDELAIIDRSLGFNWLGWYRFLEAHPWLNGVIGFAYMLMSAQVLASLLYLATTDRAGRRVANEYIWSQIITLAAIIPLSGVMPAAGAYYHYAIGTPAYLPGLLGLRDGAVHVLSITNNKGIIQFPSYHTASAVLAVPAFRFNRWLCWPNLLLSLLMILAVPTFGSHYLCDLLAGGAVALFAIWVARRIMRRFACEGRGAAATVGSKAQRASD